MYIVNHKIMQNNQTMKSGSSQGNRFKDYSRFVLIIGDLNGLDHLPEFTERIKPKILTQALFAVKNLLGKFW